MLRRGTLVSRLLALTLLVVALLLAWRLAVEPIVTSFRDTAEQIANAQNLLERYRALAAQRPRLARQLERRQEASDASIGFLQGQDETLAAAALQERVGTIIDGAGGELRSTQILPAQAADEELAIRRAGLRLQFVVTVEGLETILYRLETTEPYLFIDELGIREQRVRRRRNEAVGETLLDVNLQVYGFVRMDATEQREARRTG